MNRAPGSNHSCLGQITTGQPVARLVALGCGFWMLSYCLIGGTSTGKTFYGSFFSGDKASVPLVAVTLPILLAGLVATLAVRCESEIACYSPTRRHRAKNRNATFSTDLGSTRSCRTTLLHDGDPDINLWALWCIVLPGIVLTVTSIFRHLHGDKDLEPADAVKEVGNVFGYSAIVALSIQLIPVARHGPLLKLLGCWNPVLAVQLHVWTGRMVMALVSFHGALHMWRWSMASNMLGEGVLKMVIPPRQCFWIFPGDDGYFQPTCFNKATDCTCYDFVRNWTGLMAGVTLLIIGLSSLNCVRRTLYNVFYKIHIVAGPTMLLLVILHWNRSMLFLAGSVLYYTACSLPVVWEQQRNKKRGGVRIVSVERIQSLHDHVYRRPCIAVTVESSDLALQQFRAGQYVQLKAPAVSDISHPFTINTVARNPRQLQIIFRCVGPFTRQLAENFMLSAVAGTCNAEDERQLERHMPELYLDGFHGSPDRVRQVFKHDVVVIVAGGIGITPYLSLLQRVHGFATTHNSIMTKQLFLHWSCRDPDLIDFVKREYFDILMSESASSLSAKLRIQIVIHKTTGSDVSTAMLHADSESPKLNQWDKLSRNREGSLLYVPPEEQHGVAFSPSRWGPKNACRENRVPFVSFLLTTTGGLAGILYSYFQLQSKTTILPRLVGPLFVLLVGMLMAWISHDVSRRLGFGPESLQSAEFEPLDAIGCDDEEHFPKETTVELREASSFRLQNQLTSGIGQHHPKTQIAHAGSCVLPECDNAIPFVELEERTGRASLHDFLHALENAERPALFSCGPSALMADLRDVTEQRCLLRLQRCATEDKAPIALYEESFEM